MHVWRQTETQTVINNFAYEDMNILNPRTNNYIETDRIHRREFPIMQWVYACFHKILGPHIIISRILSFAISLLSIFAFYKLCELIFKSAAIGLIGAWTITFSPLFYYYTMNPMPDNLALCSALYCMYFYFKYINNTHYIYLLLSASFLCIATLTKLPYVVFGSIIFGEIVEHVRDGKSGKAIKAGLVFFTPLLLPFAWYISVIPSWNGNGVIKGVLDTSSYSANSILLILRGFLVSLLPETILNYGSVLFFMVGCILFFKCKLYMHRYALSLLTLLCCVSLYYLFEINMIGLVHDYYYMPFIPLAFIIVTYGSLQMLKQRKRYSRILAIICLAALPVSAYLRMNGRWNTSNPGFNPVYYNNKHEIRALLPDNTLCIVGKDHSPYILLYYVNRKGWTFDNHIKTDDLKYYRMHGAEYLLTDNRISNKDHLRKQFEKMIYHKNGLSIYKLKKLQ